MIPIPAQFLRVPYNGANYPGALGFAGLGAGANCQVFAYAFLAHHGIELPPLRSSDLWEDREHTSAVTEFEPLDLLLFHDREQAYGAHVAVFVGDGHVLHLAAHRGFPAVETVAELQCCPKYRYLIGGKRAHGR